MSYLSLSRSLVIGSFLLKCNAVPVPLTLLEAQAHPNAKCLDGSPGGYYAQEATDDESKNKWVFYLMGGGECDTEDYCVDSLRLNMGAVSFSNLRGIPPSIYHTLRVTIAMITLNSVIGTK